MKNIRSYENRNQCTGTSIKVFENKKLGWRIRAQGWDIQQHVKGGGYMDISERETMA